jgi:hypothetical protein
MALLVPKDFDVDAVEPEAERLVIKKLLAGLTDDWLVVPKVPLLIDGKNFEIDVVLVSRHNGVHLLEVKGGVISVREGEWFSYARKMKKSPFEQIVTAKHALVRRMKQMKVDLHDLYFNEIVVMPHVGDIPSIGLGPDAPKDHCWSMVDIERPMNALQRIAREVSPVPIERLVHFVKTLKPSVDLSTIDGQFHQGATSRLDDATRSHLAVLRNMDTNKRFLVTGAAGTGKTYLAEQWARRAESRGEKVLFACFNVPLGEELEERLSDTGITVRSFHRFARETLTPFGFEIPANAVSDWWQNVPANLILEHRNEIPQKYDTIVIDEAQDFPETWITALESLLDPVGPQKMLMVADPLQNIYGTSWNPPRDVPSLELSVNLRSSKVIAQRVNELGGAPMNDIAPLGPPINGITATEETLVACVSSEVKRLVSQFGIPPSQLAVLTRHRDLRDLLVGEHEGVNIVRWNQRNEDSVVCETIHRVKGLERLAIIVVDLDEEPNNDLDYVGFSRASLHLSVIRNR